MMVEITIKNSPVTSFSAKLSAAVDGLFVPQTRILIFSTTESMLYRARLLLSQPTEKSYPLPLEEKKSKFIEAV